MAKTLRDLRLKIAIIESRKTQRRIALDTRIGEGRLSQLVQRRGHPATDQEKQRLAKYLQLAVEDLFPMAIEADDDTTTRSADGGQARE